MYSAKRIGERTDPCLPPFLLKMREKLPRPPGWIYGTARGKGQKRMERAERGREEMGGMEEEEEEKGERRGVRRGRKR